MKWNRNNGLAIFLIICGALILFSKLGLGFGIGNLLSYIIPGAMMAFGYMSIRKGSKWIGWILFILGLVILLGKFSGLIAIVIAAGLIVYGVSLVKKTA